MMQSVDTWAARVLLLNSGLALAVALGLLGERLAEGEASRVFGAAMLGFIAAVLCLRRHPAGLWGAALYYALQLVSYTPLDGGPGWSVKAGVSVGLVLQFSQSIIVVNMVALALLALTTALLAWRRRR
ncbi:MULTISPECIES: hypothetical protein [unclassified Duganella]|uniref:hypothetical protein n=1 Tax=unclassified Duganella TaxID=2636909 RepID=UPI000880C9B2|nr:MULTISPECIES: hypothetical protein [unclassified Duganella]SDH23192.1 hypothetical protein SAMN05216320_1112 [Duganella sp. OV458]SDK45335.1 hypothetical protein SAMN05428973_111243 [Duganella sp. OV510]